MNRQTAAGTVPPLPRRHLAFYAITLALLLVATIGNTVFSVLVGTGPGDVIVGFNAKNRLNTATEYRYNNHGQIRSMPRQERDRLFPYAVLAVAVTAIAHLIFYAYAGIGPGRRLMREPMTLRILAGGIAIVFLFLWSGLSCVGY